MKTFQLRVLHANNILSGPYIIVYKQKDHNQRGESTAAAKESDKKGPTEPAFIPVVGENEPELKPAGPTKSARKRLDPGQLATDDFHYDKYKKRSRHY